MALGDVDMRRRARSAVEKLVAAAHGEIGARSASRRSSSAPLECARSQTISAPSCCAAAATAAMSWIFAVR